ncbi:hypothetical protein CKA81_11935 [Pollutimonas thiosulfatoxidans]|uniref:TRAP transporter small permease protein n=2 Tax=Pollutimonas thiosulfatoxidans TaxID=2028345 RepID=A0A410GDU8_9BURK|nr:hypothetical protein CKA81_11935 [Pollutimonas thiosulfatoxidans]
MKRFEKIFIRLTGYVCSSLFCLMVAVSLLQVFFRYVLNDSLVWSEELARYLFVWVSFLGAIIAFHRGMHIEVDILTSMLRDNSKRILDLLTKVLTGVFLLVLIVYGWRIVGATWGTPSAALRIPMGLVYMAIPVGGIGMLAVLIFKITNTIDGSDNITQEDKGEFHGSLHTN